MGRAVRVAAVLMLALAIGGCSATASKPTATNLTATRSTAVASAVVTSAVVTPTPTPLGSAVVAAEGGSDVGNERPHVSYDGLMVRRRVVVAIRPTSDADLVSLRNEMDKAAASHHLALTAVSSSVLDPALLEQLAPELVLALPPGGTLAEAKRLIDSPASKSGTLSGVAAYKVASVLVHDLGFRVASAHPASLAAGIAREGILSDALGNYTTTIGSRELEITYTGALLSDDLVGAVRAGIARRAGTQAAAVTVSPRSTTGTGVDMAKEPVPAPAATEAGHAHHHSAVSEVALPAALPAGPPAPSESSQSSLWAVSVGGGLVLLILALVLLMMRRIKQWSQQDTGQVDEGD